MMGQALQKSKLQTRGMSSHGAPQPLTKNEMELIRKSWPRIIENNFNEAMLETFVLIMQHRAIKNYFVYIKYANNDDELRKNVLLQFHVKKFLTLLEDTVKHIQDLPSVMTPRLLKLGAYHCQYNFPHSYYDFFEAALTDAIRKELQATSERNRKATVRAYNSLFKYLIRTMTMTSHPDKKKK